MTRVLDAQALELISHSPAQTRRLGARLGRLLEPGDVVCLEGDLGVGKTCFAQGIGQGLGVAEPIVSPTFIFIREYRADGGRPPMYHIDFYRLEDLDEAGTLGLDDYLYGDGVCVIEWADRAEPLLPDERLWIRLEVMGASKRSLVLEPTGSRYERLVHTFKGRLLGL